jgi:hypothetical protein
MPSFSQCYATPFILFCLAAALAAHPDTSPPHHTSVRGVLKKKNETKTHWRMSNLRPSMRRGCSMYFCTIHRSVQCPLAPRVSVTRCKIATSDLSTCVSRMWCAACVSRMWCVARIRRMWCVARELAEALHLDPSPARLARRFDDPEVGTPLGAAVERRLRPLQPRHLLVECGA